MASALNFKYKRVDGAFRPIIPVEFSMPKSQRSVIHEVLVDSGADWCVINAEIGEAIGLTIKNDKPHQFKGISGKVMTGYVHTVSMNVKGLKYTVPVIFARGLSDDRYSIVGQVGFFDQFDVQFRYRDRKIVLRA